MRGGESFCRGCGVGALIGGVSFWGTFSRMGEEGGCQDFGFLVLQ